MKEEKNLFIDGFKDRFTVDVDFKAYPHDLFLVLVALIIGFILGDIFISSLI